MVEEVTRKSQTELRIEGYRRSIDLMQERLRGLKESGTEKGYQMKLETWFFERERERLNGLIARASSNPLR